MGETRNPPPPCRTRRNNLRFEALLLKFLPSMDRHKGAVGAGRLGSQLRDGPIPFLSWRLPATSEAAGTLQIKYQGTCLLPLLGRNQSEFTFPRHKVIP